MKKNLNIRFIIFFFIVILTTLLGGCRDVFEEDITKKKLLINSPVDGGQSTIYKQLFWWNELDGATQYAIQVVTPSFDSMVKVLVDTVIVGSDKFYKTLEPGKYQWRIRAENGYYKTDYLTYSFTMLISPIDKQTISLTAPADNKFFGIKNGNKVTFAWDKLFGATNYILQIDTADGDFTSSIVDTTVTDNSIFYKLKEGEYIWRVKAKDDDGNETPWSSVYTTGYFGTKPTTPVLNYPKTDTLTDKTSIKLSWKEVKTAQTYRVSIYKNPANPAVDVLVESSTGFTIDAPTLYKVLTLTNYALDDMVYWNVYAIDKAGNKSDLSETRYFKIN